MHQAVEKGIVILKETKFVKRVSFRNNRTMDKRNGPFREILFFDGKKPKDFKSFERD